MRDVTVCCEVPVNATEVSLASVLETQRLHDAAIDTTVAQASVNQTKKGEGFGIKVMDATRMPNLNK